VVLSSSGAIGRHVFSGVSLAPGETGKLTLDLLSSSPVLTLRVDGDGDGVFEDSVVETSQEILTVPPPTLLAATVIGPETSSVSSTVAGVPDWGGESIRGGRGHRWRW